MNNGKENIFQGRVITVRNRRSLLVLFFATLQGCAGFAPNSEKHGVLRSAAFEPAPRETRIALNSLPLPAGKIVTAVYGFRDLTGQNKPSPSSGLSTAVTQGSSSILGKSLLDSGWFQPVERNGLQNLLTERNLWNQKLGNAKLAPLPPASVIIEGGIIGYDFNVRTGGAGAKYLGIGGSTSYREDTVTINIRVVNAKDGSILHSIDSSKSVYSKSVNTGVFGFTSFDHLLELESGYAFNEPIFESVQEAINSALVNLVSEGLVRGTWKLADPEEIYNDVFEKFLNEAEKENYAAKFSQQSDEVASVSVITDQNSPVAAPNPAAEPIPANQDSPLSQPNAIASGVSESNDRVSPLTKSSTSAKVETSVDADVLGRGAGVVEFAVLSKDQEAKLNDELKRRDKSSKEYLAAALKEEDDYQRRIARIREQKRQELRLSSMEPAQDSGQPNADSRKVVKSVSLLVGQFNAREEAQEFQKKLAKKITQTNVAVASNPEGTSFKIIIGELLSQQEIDSTILKLREVGVEQVQVVKNY